MLSSGVGGSLCAFQLSSALLAWLGSWGKQGVVGWGRDSLMWVMSLALRMPRN